MQRGLLFSLGSLALAFKVAAQTAVDVARPEERQKARQAVVKEQERVAKRTSSIQFRGQRAFDEKELRVALKEEITTIEQFGLSPARADDLAFFVEVFYRKHGYAKVNVHYVIESTDRLRLDITEGPRFMLRTVLFEGNAKEPADKLFEYMVGPTRERYSRLEKRLPFVATDMEDGTNLVHRFYIAEGFLGAVVDPPRYKFQEQSSEVDVVVPIHEGRQYFFGTIGFSGRTIYGGEALRGQIADLLQSPYTDTRVEDIPRRLEAYFKARGYYDVKVAATGAPDEAVNGRIPVQIVVSPGPVYYFDGVTVNGLTRPQFCDEAVYQIEWENVQSGRSRRAISHSNENGIVQCAANQASASRWAFVATRHFCRGSQEQGVWLLGRIRHLRRRAGRRADWRSRSVRHWSRGVGNDRSLTAQLQRRNSVPGSVLS
jgi:outer membrane protein assembly factor BamA